LAQVINRSFFFCFSVLDYRWWSKYNTLLVSSSSPVSWFSLLLSKLSRARGRAEHRTSMFFPSSQRNTRCSGHLSREVDNKNERRLHALFPLSAHLAWAGMRQHTTTHSLWHTKKGNTFFSVVPYILRPTSSLQAKVQQGILVLALLVPMASPTVEEPTTKKFQTP